MPNQVLYSPPHEKPLPFPSAQIELLPLRALLPWTKFELSHYSCCYLWTATIFPRETWHKHNDGVYVASARHPLVKELEMAEILAHYGHVVYLSPEIGKGKHADAIVDGVLTEFKHITGNENAISHRFRESLHQGQNVCLNIGSDTTAQRVWQRLKGVLKDKDEDGIVFVYMQNDKKLYRWDMRNIK